MFKFSHFNWRPRFFFSFDKFSQEDKKQDEETSKPAAKDSNAPRFEIKKWNAVAMWSWDICADTVCLFASLCVYSIKKERERELILLFVGIRNVTLECW